MFSQLSGKYSGLELELEKNKLKRNLPAVTDHGDAIEIADYVARTLLENEKNIKAFVQ
jgi:hypothetical protein